MNSILEVCCGSYDDALTAKACGIKRIELCSSLFMQGLTPSIGTFLTVKEKTDLEVICLVRNRGAGFDYSDNEKLIMMADAKSLLENGADGISFGFLLREKAVDLTWTKKMVDLIHSYGKIAVFNRAIDICEGIEDETQKLIDLGVDRLLTSGIHKTAIEGMDTIGILQREYGDKIEIMAGGGINFNNAQYLIDNTGVKQIQASCMNYKVDHTSSNYGVSFSYSSEHNCYEYVDHGRLADLVNSLK